MTLGLVLQIACVNNEDLSTTPDPSYVNYDPGAFVLRSDHETVMATGKAKFYAQGGNHDFTYFVEDVNAGTIDPVTGELIAGVPGTYTVKVRDALGEIAEKQITVYTKLEPSPMSSEIYIEEVQTVDISGGIPPYTVTLLEGGGTLNIIDADTFEITAPDYETTILTRIVDSAGNYSAADIKVFAPFTVTPLEGKIPSNRTFTIETRGGKEPYTYTLVNGQGTFDTTTLTYTPDETKEEKSGGTGLVHVQVHDSLGTSFDVKFEVFIPHSLAVGDNHSCALNNVTGKVKCWGKGFDGVLGNGDENGGVYWGDEPAERNGSALITKSVQFWDPLLESYDRIHDYFIDHNVICAVIEDTGSGRRDIRCLGSSTRADSTNEASLGNSSYSNFFKHRFISRGEQFFADPYNNRGRWFNKPDIFKLNYYDSSSDGFKWSFGAGPSHKINLFDTFSHWYDDGFVVDQIKLADKGYRSRRTMVSTDYRLKVFYHEGYNEILGGGENAIDNANQVTQFKDGKITEVYQAEWAGYLACVLSDNVDHPGLELVHCFGDNTVTSAPAFQGILGVGPGNYVKRSDEMVAEPIDFDGNLSIDAEDEASDIMVGSRVGCALLKGPTTNGQVYCWGWNERGMLGVNQDHATLTGADRPIGPLSFGGQSVKSLENVGGSFCAVTTSDELWCWGYNYNLAVGNGSSSDVHLPTKVNVPGAEVYTYLSHAMCSIRLDGGNKRLFCWGRGNVDGFYFPSDPPRSSGATNYTTPTEFFIDNMAGIDPIMIKNGFSNGCLLPASRDRLECWGSNHHGQLGYDNTTRGDHPGELGDKLPEIDIDGTNKVIKLVSGAKHVCALLETNKLKCWGSNAYGQLGLGDLVTPDNILGNMGDNRNEMGANLPFVSAMGEDQFKDVFAAFDNTCVITITDKVYCWGRNNRGQLGVGNATDQFLATSEVVLDSDTDFYPKSIALGRWHTCVVLGHSTEASLDGKAKCWGFGPYGQLGYPYDNSAKFTGYGIASSNEVIGDSGSDTTIQDLPYINFASRKVQSISTGQDHTCFLFDNGKVKCLGFSERGAIGIGRIDNDGDGDNDPIGDEFFELGETYLADMGTNVNTQSPHTVRDIRSGAEFNCAILEDDRLKCWGSGLYGQLGIENRVLQGEANNEMGNQLPYVKVEPGVGVLRLQSGPLHSCAVLANNQVKCWGINYFGQLGYGDFLHRGWGQDQMSGSLPYIPLWE